MNITDETFEQEVLQSPIPVLVDFYATWCQPCKIAAPTIDALAKEFEGRVKVVKLDVDTGAKYAMDHGVRGIPNFILFAGGIKVAQFVGWGEHTDQDLREALVKVLAS
jgi:thioredoxin 1